MSGQHVSHGLAAAWHVTQKPQLFPHIGAVVEETAKLPEPEEKAEETGPTAEDEDRPVQEIESLCMKCEQQVRSLVVHNLEMGYIRTFCQQGVTRLLLTSIPFFKEVIVMSFRCEHCGFSNNEIQSAGTIRRKPSHSLRLLPRLMQSSSVGQYDSKLRE